MRVVAALSLLLFAGGCTTKQFVKVAVESNPTSAEVWLGDEQKDSTPCTLLFDSEGKFELLVKKPGYLTVKRLVTVFAQKDDKGESFLVVNPDHMTVTLDPAEPGGAATAPSGDGTTTPGTTTKPYYQ